MSTDAKAPVELAVITKDAKAFIDSVRFRPKVKAASDALSAFQKFGGVIVCVSDEEMAKLGEMRLAMRTGVRDIEEARKEGFRPYETVKKMVADFFKTKATDPLEAAIGSLDRSILTWQEEKERRAAEERRQREEEQEKAEAAARAAAEQAAVAGVEDEDVPPPFAADLGTVPEPETRARTETATTFLRTTLEATLEDHAAAIKAWPQAFTFSPTACAKAFKDQGGKQPDPGENVLVGGVRFTVVRSVSGRAR